MRKPFVVVVVSILLIVIIFKVILESQWIFIPVCYFYSPCFLGTDKPAAGEFSEQRSSCNRVQMYRICDYYNDG